MFWAVYPRLPSSHWSRRWRIHTGACVGMHSVRWATSTLKSGRVSHAANAGRLSKQFGRGFSYTSAKRMKQFCLTFPQGSSIPQDIGGEKSSTSFSLSAEALAARFPPLIDLKLGKLVHRT